MKTEKTLIALIKARVIELIERLKQEPVLVRSALMLLAGAGIVEISGAQMDKIEAIALIVLFLLGSNSIRRNVTPVKTKASTERAAQEVKTEDGGQE